MSGKGRGRGPTLVKFILTQHVQTDERDFKATVQNLTGMHANVGGFLPESTVAAGRQYECPGQVGAMRRPEGVANGGFAESLMAEDFCRWSMELPSLDEQGLWQP